MRQFLLDSYVAQGSNFYIFAADLEWWIAGEDNPDAIYNSRLWFDDADNLIGFAWPGEGEVDLQSHPEHRDVERDMLAWAEEERRQVVDGGSPSTLSVWCYEQDQARYHLLQQRNYHRTERCYHQFRQEITEELREPALPAGYSLRQFAGESEIEQRVAAHRSAFDPSRMTVEKHRRVMASPGYRQDLDLVVEGPDGSLAAYCIVWFDEQNRSGLFEPVGCHQDHRRRGLAGTVIVEGLRRLRELGATVAYVNSHGEDIPSNQLYISTGFQIVEREYRWSVTLS